MEWTPPGTRYPLRHRLGKHREGLFPVEVVQSTGERVRKAATQDLDQLDTAQIGAGSTGTRT